jgi:phospholipid-translocating ATPase
MTVIVRNPEGRILVMCKGADSIILPLLHKEAQNVEKTVKILEGFSKEGLRTLLIAEKEISEDDYNIWNGKYHQALIAKSNREDKIAEVSAEIETDFYLIGSTAIEDKLQDDVADTIEFLKDAGIKVWVLTGDKIETAINIGVSCKLLS